MPSTKRDDAPSSAEEKNPFVLFTRYVDQQFASLLSPFMNQPNAAWREHDRRMRQEHAAREAEASRAWEQTMWDLEESEKEAKDWYDKVLKQITSRRDEHLESGLGFAGEGEKKNEAEELACPYYLPARAEKVERSVSETQAGGTRCSREQPHSKFLDWVWSGWGGPSTTNDLLWQQDRQQKGYFDRGVREQAKPDELCLMQMLARTKEGIEELEQLPSDDQKNIAPHQVAKVSKCPDYDMWPAVLKQEWLNPKDGDPFGRSDTTGPESFMGMFERARREAFQQMGLDPDSDDTRSALKQLPRKELHDMANMAPAFVADREIEPEKLSHQVEVMTSLVDVVSSLSENPQALLGLMSMAEKLDRPSTMSNGPLSSPHAQRNSHLEAETEFGMYEALERATRNEVASLLSGQSNPFESLRTVRHTERTIDRHGYSTTVEVTDDILPDGQIMELRTTRVFSPTGSLVSVSVDRGTESRKMYSRLANVPHTTNTSNGSTTEMARRLVEKNKEEHKTNGGWFWK